MVSCHEILDNVQRRVSQLKIITPFTQKYQLKVSKSHSLIESNKKEKKTEMNKKLTCVSDKLNCCASVFRSAPTT